MDFYEKHRKTVHIVAGVAGATLFATWIYYLLKNNSSVMKNGDSMYFLHHKTKRLDKNSILVKIKIAYEGERLALSTVAQIYDGALELASEKYIKLTKHNREARRAVFDDLKKYVGLHNAYTLELDKTIEGCQKELLVELGIPDFVWDDSMGFYTNQENSVILRLYDGVSHKLKKNLESSRVLSKNDLKQIMKTEIELFEKEGENIEAIRSLLKNNEEIMSVVHSRVNDQLAEQFGAEEEDIMSSIRHHKNDSEVYGLSAQIQRLTGNRLTGY